jgi:hypothetical protein
MTLEITISATVIGIALGATIVVRGGSILRKGQRFRKHRRRLSS